MVTMQVIVDGTISANLVGEAMPACRVARHEPRSRPHVDAAWLYQEPPLATPPRTGVYLVQPGVQVIVNDDDFEIRLIRVIGDGETKVTDGVVKAVQAIVDQGLEPDGETVEHLANSKLGYANLGPEHRDRRSDARRFDHEASLCQLGKRVIHLPPGHSRGEEAGYFLGAAMPIQERDDMLSNRVANERRPILTNERHGIARHYLSVVPSADERANRYGKTARTPVWPVIRLAQRGHAITGRPPEGRPPIH
jgi:hypothetical protein